MFKQYKNKRKCLYFFGISIILLIIGGHYLLGFLPAVLEQKEKMNSAYSMLHLSTKTGHKNFKNSHGNLNVRQTLSKC